MHDYSDACNAALLNSMDEATKNVLLQQEHTIMALGDALEQITRHFTKTPSTLADTEMRCMAHRALKDMK